MSLRWASSARRAWRQRTRARTCARRLRHRGDPCPISTVRLSAHCESCEHGLIRRKFNALRPIRPDGPTIHSAPPLNVIGRHARLSRCSRREPRARWTRFDNMLPWNGSTSQSSIESVIDQQRCCVGHQKSPRATALNKPRRMRVPSMLMSVGRSAPSGRRTTRPIPKDAAAKRRDQSAERETTSPWLDEIGEMEST